MSRIRIAAAAAVGLVGVLLTLPAYAQSASSSDAEIALLKQQLKLMEQKLDKMQKQTTANTEAAAKANAKAANADAKVDAKLINANAAYPTKGPILPVSGAIVTMPNNRPTICTVDNENCIAFTSRLHFDVGGYNYRPHSAGTIPQALDNGENARRARIGVIGKFLGDWNYALIYDFGGSSDGFGGSASGSLAGGGTSGIENAYLSYTGFNPFGGKLAIEGGIMDVAYTLDESTSSNDIMFMERASSGIIAQNIAAGDFRSAFGARWFNDRFWIGSYVTGPTSGAAHTAAVSSEQLGVTARAAGQLLSGKNYSLHLGGDALWLVDPPRPPNGVAALTLSDRPELRIDPTTIVSTGALQNVSGAQVYSVEAAGTYGPLYFQGEYFWYNIDRTPALGLSSIKFEGGYAEASVMLTGETHTYNPATAAYGAIVPLHPADWKTGGWGAWEVAGRISQVNLNDELGRANGVSGGRQTVYTAGLNWYVNRNIRFVFNYLHGDIDKQAGATNINDVGASFDAIAMRTQVAF
jgi:phosphate-selective porin OprO/OprP